MELFILFFEENMMSLMEEGVNIEGFIGNLYRIKTQLKNIY
jgi:hypothetical protein